MHQTLFFIPYEIFGLPLFGFGILAVLWGIGIIAGWFLYRKYAPEKSVSEGLQVLGLALFSGFLVCWLLPKAGCAAGIPIRAYGTMMLLGILLSFGLAVWRAPRYGFTAQHIQEILFWLCIPGILGARLFYVIEYWDSFKAPTLGQTLANIANIPEGGLVVYGSIIGGFLGGVVYLLWKRLSILRMMDLLAPCMMLGLALGRLGCFLNGCCFGGVCDAAHEHWGVHFPAGSPPFEQQLAEGKIHLDPHDLYHGMRFASDRNPRTAPAPTFVEAVSPGSKAAKNGVQAEDYVLSIQGIETPERETVIQALIWGTRQSGKIEMTLSRFDGTAEKTETVSWTTLESSGPVSLAVYPTQLYSSVNALLVCGTLLLYSRFRRHASGIGQKFDGETFALFLTLYPITRFILEMIRTDEASAFGTGLSISQNVSLVLLLAAAGVWAFVLLRPHDECRKMCINAENAENAEKR